MCCVVNQDFGILYYVLDIIRSSYIQRRSTIYIEMWLAREAVMHATDAGIRGLVLDTQRACNVRYLL